MKNEQLLACRVYPGMFSDEVAVAYPPMQQAKTSVSSFFVPRDRVMAPPSEHQLHGMLRVRVIRDGTTVWAIVPDENQSVIEVEESDLSSL